MIICPQSLSLYSSTPEQIKMLLKHLRVGSWKHLCVLKANIMRLFM